MHQDAKKFTRVYFFCDSSEKFTLLSSARLTFLLMLSDDNFIFLLNKLVVEKFGISLLIKALGGLLGSFSNTINKIETRGKVNFGDKSFLDIYVPIHQELIQNNLIDFDKIITKIDESLEYTKSLEARVGRAKFLDSKGVGVIDPGAYSTSIILKEFFKEINNEKNN